MPSRLFTQRLMRQRPRDEEEGPMATTVVVATAPWQGYSPDIPPILVDIAFFEDVSGLVPYHGKLTLDAGYEKYEDPAEAPTLTLPLGGNNTNPATPTDSTALTNTTSALAQPIIGFAEIIRRDTTTDRNWLYCITGVSEKGGSAAISGFVWAYDPTNEIWVNCPWSNQSTGAEIKADRDQLYDTVFYPFGGTAIGGGDRPGMLVICDTTKGDEVYIVDPGENNVAGDAQPPGNYDTFGQFGGGDFFATSVEVIDGRVCFLNTTEAGSEEKNRVRYTDVRATAPSFTAAGAGSVDWGDFKGDGLRILRIADMGACYFTDGVGFLRRNFQQARPFLLQYLVTTRGLLSTFAVTPISEDMHFGIFTDGWYFLKADGSFLEAGNAQGSQNNKWFDTFYNSVDNDNIHRLVISYDRYYHRIRVSWPDQLSGEQVIWIYDIDTDSVWPDQSYDAVSWGITDPVLDPGAGNWEDQSGSWSDFTGRWIDQGPVFGDRTVIHGSTEGYVFVRNNNVTTQSDDGTGLPAEISWRISTHKPEFGDPQAMVGAYQTRIMHEGLNSSVPFTLGVVDHQGMVTVQGLDMQTGDVLDVGVAVSQYTNFQVVSPRLGMSLSGVGPAVIHSLQMTLVPELGLEIKNL